MSKAITIVLADDHQIVREGLRRVLEAEPGLTVVGEAGDGLEVVTLVQRLKPRVLVVDLMMPNLGGLEVAREVTVKVPGTAVLILSMYAEDPFVLEALRNGAAGYVPKDESSEELVKAIREVAAGRHYLSPPLSESVIKAYLGSTAAPSDVYNTLTLRERQVLHLAAEGLSAKAIAQRLAISPRTAETHRAHLMRKLDLHTRTDLIRFAIRRGILPPEKDQRAG